MLARNTELADYIADNYGECARGSSDCYHGGGCLKTGWLGRACPHWRPVTDRDFIARVTAALGGRQ